MFDYSFICNTRFLSHQCYVRVSVAVEKLSSNDLVDICSLLTVTSNSVGNWSTAYMISKSYLNSLFSDPPLLKYPLGLSIYYYYYFCSTTNYAMLQFVYHRCIQSKEQKCPPKETQFLGDTNS